jgi:hypothetical protein
MGPNDADIIRVSTRESNGNVADNTLDPGKDAEVVVEVEAGSAIFGTGGQWQVGVHVRDLDGGNINTVLAPTPAMSGHLGTAPWTTQRAIFRYTIPAGNLTAHKGHLGRVHAYLLVGTNAANYDASFVESDPFLVLP